MAFKPMSPSERASIEAQVLIKCTVELTCAQLASGTSDPNEDILTLLADNSGVLMNTLLDLKAGLNGALTSAEQTIVQTDQVAPVLSIVENAFPGATVSQARGESKYIDDSEYASVHKLWLVEQASGVTYGSKESVFMDNQVVRKLFADGARTYPNNYWSEQMRGEPIPATKNNKCALGDFKIKRGVFVDGEGNLSLQQGDGNHPQAGKSGYFGGLVKHSPFNWGERPDPVSGETFASAGG